MSISVFSHDRISMSQKERDVLKIMHAVSRGERTQAEAARLLDKSIRQVRRILRQLQAGGDAAIVHGLRGKPSNHQPDAKLRQAVLAAYRRHYADFGPTFASEKLAEHGLHVDAQTLRSRRPRRACFGELVQMDASIHDWLEGRGEEVVLISMIDDATSRILARFYTEGTVQTHMDLLGRWRQRYGRPLALYTDRHSIFEPQDKGHALPDAVTQFGRALQELGIDLIYAHSPQAKGRVERSFGTAQDRWVKELRLAGVDCAEGANAVLARLLPAHNRRFAKAARETTDAHRPLGPGHNLAAILSLQEERVVSNDYTVRFQNRFYQLLPPVYPGQRGGRVVIEQRLEGSLAIRFRDKYLAYREIPIGGRPGGSAPRPPEFSASTADAREEKKGQASSSEARPSGVQPVGGRWGRTPAEPYPPDDAAEDTAKEKYRPAENHPWRKPYQRKK
jgi:hypothetical protein